MNNKNLKSIRAKLKSACSSNNISIDNDNSSDMDKIKYNKINNDNQKNNEKSLDGEISFNITPDEDDIKRDLHKINPNKRSTSKNPKSSNINYSNIPHSKHNECNLFHFNLSFFN